MHGYGRVKLLVLFSPFGVEESLARCWWWYEVTKLGPPNSATILFWTVVTIAEAAQNSNPLAQSSSVWLMLRRQLLSSEEGKGNSGCRF